MPFLGQGFLSVGMYQDIPYVLQAGIIPNPVDEYGFNMNFD